MLTVWAVRTGTKYTPDYLTRLHSAVKRNLVQPFTFAAITDQPEPIPGTAYQASPDLPGWWQKLALFHLTRKQRPEHRNLYIDLDSVIVGNLDGLLESYAKSRLAMPRNWARSGHGGWQSSLMIWEGGAFPELHDHNTAADRSRLWGDQEWITQRLGETVDEIQPGLVVSYKYHCGGGEPPAGACVVTFHGRPDPHEVTDQWVARCWR